MYHVLICSLVSVWGCLVLLCFRFVLCCFDLFCFALFVFVCIQFNFMCLLCFVFFVSLSLFSFYGFLMSRKGIKNRPKGQHSRQAFVGISFCITLGCFVLFVCVHSNSLRVFVVFCCALLFWFLFLCGFMYGFVMCMFCLFRF